MESFDLTKLKFEKANTVLRYRRLRNITALLRFIEVCAVLIMISRFSSQFPVNFKLSGGYFRALSLNLFSPRFVFVVGNAIVAVLFLKSGNHPSQDDAASMDFYKEYVATSEKNRHVHRVEIKSRPKQSTAEVGSTVTHSNREKKIQRSQSENLKREVFEKPRRELRRSVTERCPENLTYVEKPPASSYSEDNMSSEEFRRTVEAFIARQQRYLREE